MNDYEIVKVQVRGMNALHLSSHREGLFFYISGKIFYFHAMCTIFRSSIVHSAIPQGK